MNIYLNILPYKGYSFFYPYFCRGFFVLFTERLNDINLGVDVMKGVLIQKNKKHGTFLTGNGEFIKGKHNNRDIGEELEIEKSSMDIKKVALVMVLVIALVGGYMPYNAMTSAYGYVEIDINPSVELGYNENMKVIKLNALNDEGKDILANIDLKLKGMQLDAAVEAIIAYAELAEYSTDDVVITYTHSDETDIDDAVGEILCNIDDGDGNVICIEIEKEKYEEIKEENKGSKENIPPAVHVLKGKIADMNGEISALEEEIGEKKYQSYNKNLKEYLKEHYDSDNIDDIEKVSDLAHIRNKVKKDLHDFNKELEKQEKETNGNDIENGNHGSEDSNGDDNQGKGKGNNGGGKGN
jgi:hypothetical protein